MSIVFQILFVHRFSDICKWTAEGQLMHLVRSHSNINFVAVNVPYVLYASDH